MGVTTTITNDYEIQIVIARSTLGVRVCALLNGGTLTS